MPTLEKTREGQQVAVPMQVQAGSHADSQGADAHAAVRRASRASEGEDRRITRSRKALREALVQLMEECGLESITVNDLCQRAGLTRGTFYNHYPDKEALLEAFEQEIMDDLEAFERSLGDLGMREVLSYVARKRPLPFLVQLFDYLRSQGDFLHAALGPGGDVRFGPRLRDSLCTQIVEGMLHEQYRDNPTPFVGYYVSFFASAYLGVIMRWVETGMREDSQEMALISQRLLFIRPGESIRL